MVGVASIVLSLSHLFWQMPGLTWQNLWPFGTTLVNPLFFFKITSVNLICLLFEGSELSQLLHLHRHLSSSYIPPNPNTTPSCFEQMRRSSWSRPDEKLICETWCCQPHGLLEVQTAGAKPGEFLRLVSCSPGHNFLKMKFLWSKRLPTERFLIGDRKCLEEFCSFSVRSGCSLFSHRWFHCCPTVAPQQTSSKRLTAEYLVRKNAR